jgi:hypothetical protein
MYPEQGRADRAQGGWKSGPDFPPVERGSTVKRLAVGIVVTGSIVGLIGSAGAAPRIASGTIEMSSTLRAAPALGSEVTLSVTFAGLKRADTPKVQIVCMQNGDVVYAEAHEPNASPAEVGFLLGSNSPAGTSIWAGGSAECRADLYYLSPSAGRSYVLDWFTFTA